ncbi:MAG: metalloregulator ArsR/SmtB family transcription factor [Bellilinea sp.]
MDKFSALGDPNRRRIVELLANQGPLTATEISKKFSVSPSAISQHLKILREADLIQMKKQAQKRIYEINPMTMREMENWAKRLTALWDQRFDALETIIEAEKRKQV